MMGTTMTFGGKKVSVVAASCCCSLAISAATAFLILWKNRRRLQLHASSKDDDEKVIVVDLLPIEETLAMGGGGDNAMSTLTWFRGDYRQALTFLERRALEILKLNPWLSGRVVSRKRRKIDGKRHRVLVYNKDLISRSNDDSTSTTLELLRKYHFQCLLDVKNLSRDLPVERLGAALSHLLLKDGPTQPLWKVTILVLSCSKRNPTTTTTTTNNNDFAVVFSMSHIIADGHTFYKIQNMLFNSSKDESSIQSLIVQRIASSPQQQIQALGGRAEYSVLQSPGFIVSCVWGVLKSLIFTRAKAECRLFYIDPVVMELYKQQAQDDDDVDFVSTNDVLTSWFFQNSSCQYGMMAINFRTHGRCLEGHSDLHAGNYENVIFYNRQDSATPGLVRQSLLQQPYRRVITGTNSSTPSFYSMATGSFAICTNWSSFAEVANIPNCREDFHMPLYDMANLLPSTLATMSIFRCGSNSSDNDDDERRRRQHHRLAVLVAGTPDKLDSLLEDAAPFLIPP